MVAATEHTKEHERLMRMYEGNKAFLVKIGVELMDLCTAHEKHRFAAEREAQRHNVALPEHISYVDGVYGWAFRTYESLVDGYRDTRPCPYPYKRRHQWEREIDECEAKILRHVDQVQCRVIHPIKRSMAVLETFTQNLYKAQNNELI
jgi:hypothetical protein